MMITPELIWTRIVPIASVFCIAAGQLLFKQSAILMNGPIGWKSPSAILVLFAALGIYGAATLAWIGALRHSPLSSLYPIMALSFIIVPIGSALFFRERLNLTYGLGCVALIVGLVLIGRASGQFR